MLKYLRKASRSSLGKGTPGRVGVGEQLAGLNDLATDEYVEHLRFVVGGYLLRGNVEGFEYCVRNMPDGGAMVEIGSFLGLSTNIIAYAAHKYGRTNPFFTCDSWTFAGSERPKAGYFSTGSPDYRDWVMTLFRLNTTLFSPAFAPHTIEASSDEFFAMWGRRTSTEGVLGRRATLGGAISFAYIDGDHTYDVAKRDFANVDRFLLPGGYLFFDDSADPVSYEGLARLMQEIDALGSYQLALTTPNYCFRKKG